MVMNAVTLSSEIRTALGINPTDTVATNAWNTIAEKIITHITTNAVVTTTGGNGTIA
jgi:hypothetical protein